MGNSTWSRDEHIVVLDLYLNHPDVVEDTSDPAVQDAADIIGRTPDSVVFRMGNYRHLDPRGTQGLSNVSAGCREIWEDYYGNEDELSQAAQGARQRLSTPTESGTSESDDVVHTDEVEVSGTARQGQADFRAEVRARFDDTCALCDVSRPGLLQAGHILPWHEFETDRGEIDNGILLCYLHHRAFDLGLFAITESHEVVIKPGLSDMGTFLERTLVDSETVSFPGDTPSDQYLRRRNERLDWWPLDE